MRSRRSTSLLALGAITLAAPFNVAFRFAPPVFLLPLVALALAVGLLTVAGGRGGLTPSPGRTPPRSSRRRRWLGALVAATIGGVWLSAFAGPDLPLHAATAARVCVMPLLALATALHVEDRADRAFLGRLAAVGAAAGAALGAVVLVAGHEVVGSDVFFGQITRLGASDRLTRPWAHANVAAMAIGASAAGVAALGSLRARVVMGATLVAALVATASRGGILALIVGAVAWMALARDDRRRAVVQVAGLAVVVVASIVASPSVTGRVGADEPLRWWGVEIDAPASLAIGPDGAPTSIRIENTSEERWAAEGSEAVVLSARFALEGSSEVVGEQRWPLPRPMDPSERLELDLVVEPLAPEGPVEITWDLLLDQRAYFRQFTGLAPVITQADVVGPTPAGEPTSVGAFIDPPGRPSRPDLWRSGLTQFIDNPLLGAGPGGYSRGLDELTVSHGHSLVIEPLVSWGLLGTAPMLAIVAGAVVHAVRRAWASRDPFDRAVAAGVFAVAAHGLVDWHLVHVSVAIPLGILVGISWAPPPTRS